MQTLIVEVKDEFMPSFLSQLREMDDVVIKYIAKDKPMASINFKDDLKKMINNLPNFPEKFRQSEYFDDKNIRDMIFKGYIIYEIDSKNDTIEVLDIMTGIKHQKLKNR